MRNVIEIAGVTLASVGAVLIWGWPAVLITIGVWLALSVAR